MGETVTIAGWVKTGRNQAKGAFAFVHISDGSTIQTLQVLIESTLIDLKQVISTGTGLAVRGELVSSPGDNQAVELKVCFYLLFIFIKFMFTNFLFTLFKYAHDFFLQFLFTFLFIFIFYTFFLLLKEIIQFQIVKLI